MVVGLGHNNNNNYGVQCTRSIIILLCVPRKNLTPMLIPCSHASFFADVDICTGRYIRHLVQLLFFSKLRVNNNNSITNFCYDNNSILSTANINFSSSDFRATNTRFEKLPTKSATATKVFPIIA
jgi:hypothetical protein